VLLANVALWFCIVFDKQLENAARGDCDVSIMLLGGGLLLLVDFMALTRVGMWMALRNGAATESRDPRHILRVMLAPWLEYSSGWC